IVVAEDDRGARMRHGVAQQKFELTPRHRARARDVAAVVLAGLPDVDQRKRCAALEKVLERLARDLVGHVWLLFRMMCTRAILLRARGVGQTTARKGHGSRLAFQTSPY